MLYLLFELNLKDLDNSVGQSPCPLSHWSLFDSLINIWAMFTAKECFHCFITFQVLRTGCLILIPIGNIMDWVCLVKLYYLWSNNICRPYNMWGWSHAPINSGTLNEFRFTRSMKYEYVLDHRYGMRPVNFINGTSFYCFQIVLHCPGIPPCQSQLYWLYYI